MILDKIHEKHKSTNKLELPQYTIKYVNKHMNSNSQIK